MSSQDPFASLYAADAFPTGPVARSGPITPGMGTQTLSSDQLNQLYQQITGGAPNRPLGGGTAPAAMNSNATNPNLPGSTASTTGFTPSMTPNLSNYFSNPQITNPSYNPVQFGNGAFFGAPPTPFNTGGVSIGSALVNMANQSQNEALAGQGAMNNILAPYQGFNSTLGAFTGNAMGETGTLMNELPASLNWAGQAATGDLSTQNALVQSLLGQTLGGINNTQNQTTGTLQGIMNAGQNTTGVLGNGPGLTNNAQNMLNAIGGQLASPLSQSLGFLNQGLDPSVSAALGTQAMDQTANQYNNAKQGVMTQLLQQGAMGGGAANPGASSQQMLTDLGNLSTAQQSQQSQLQQQAILANQNALMQNRAYGLQGIGLTGNIANQFTSLEQQAAETQAQQALGAAGELGSLGLQGAGLTGGLSSSLGNLYNSGALGFGGLTNQYYNTAENYPTPYLNATNSSFENLLNGANQFGQLGIEGTASTAPFLSSAVSLTDPGATQSLIGAGLGALGSVLGHILPTI